MTFNSIQLINPSGTRLSSTNEASRLKTLEEEDNGLKVKVEKDARP